MVYPKHLHGREKRLVSEGLCDPDAAAWLALVCLHSGVFTRRQWIDFQNMGDDRKVGRVHAKRLAEKLEERGLVTSDDRLGRGLGTLARVTNKRIYRLLGVANSQLRRDASPSLVLQRLGALDFVLECPEYPWLATGTEKFRAFVEGAGAPEEVLPQRTYEGQDGTSTTRYFPGRMPVAAVNKCARFVYTDDGESSTVMALRTWAGELGPLWGWLLDHGFDLETVFVSRNNSRLLAAVKAMAKWSMEAGGGRVAPGSPEALAEAGQIERALQSSDHAFLAKCGGAVAATRRLDLLKGRKGEDGKLIAPRAPIAVMRSHAWWAGRLSYHPGPGGTDEDDAEPGEADAVAA